ncbi:MAG: hypothetical protein IKM33_05400 [Clostridia bacterium]|nr:hypothetical protein [Clostridia bacterium]
MALGKVSKREASPCDGLPAHLPTKTKSMLMHLGKDWGLEAPFGGGRSLVDGVNLSPRKGGTPASRLPRRGFVNYGKGTPHGMVFFNGALVFARGTGLYSTTDGVSVQTLAKVSDTHKSFVIFGNRLYIYPDKLYIKGGFVSRPLELDTGVIPDVEFSDNTIRLPDGYDWSNLGFEVGDCVKVSGAKAGFAPEGYYHIQGLDGKTVTVSQGIASPRVVAARFQRVVPALTACCVCGDRVYGIAGKKIYVSAAGSATDFYSGSTGDGSHAATLSGDVDGEFTALSPWQGYVVFFKDDHICKLLGSRADSFTLQDRRGVGVPAALAHTLCEVGDALYYAAAGGVWRYRGQEPEWVCSFGGDTVQAGCGGTDGRAYYLSVSTDGRSRLSLYMPEEGRWYPEDGTPIGAMLCHDGLLWMQEASGIVWTTASDGRVRRGGVSEETMKGPVTASMTLVTDRPDEPARICSTGLWVRATGRSGALRVYATYADGAAGLDAQADGEVLLGEFSAPMTDRLLAVSSVAGLWDAVTVRVETEGDWVIHDVIRRYDVAQE